MLLALQGVLLVWFGMIMRVAYRVLSGQGADDSRSDDEDDDEETIEDPMISIKSLPQPPLSDPTTFTEKEILSTDPSFETRSHIPSATNITNGNTKPVRRSSRKKQDGHSSSVNLLAGSDRKDLLGRIGCDKPGPE
jgi:acyl-CoA-dependent ceramide synthase